MLTIKVNNYYLYGYPEGWTAREQQRGIASNPHTPGKSLFSTNDGTAWIGFNDGWEDCDMEEQLAYSGVYREIK